jgi:hypothetical protein
MKLHRPNLARIAVAVVWLFAIQAVTMAGGELVRIIAPKNGEQVKGLVRVQAQTTIDDPSYLIFCVDGNRPHSTNTQPYTYDLDTAVLPDGPHALVAEVYSREGLIGQSSPVTVVVANGGQRGGPTAVAAASGSSPQVEPPAMGIAAEERGMMAPAAEDEGAPGQSDAVAPMLVLQPVVTRAVSPSRRDPTKRAAAPGPSPTPKLHVRASGELRPTVTIILDGRALSFDVAPAMYEGQAFGGLRKMIEQSGGSVDWLHAAKQAIAERSRMRLQVTIGAREAIIDGRTVELGATVRLRDGRTLVPVRTACEPMGYKVAWSGDSHTVRMSSKPEAVKVGALPAH